MFKMKSLHTDAGPVHDGPVSLSIHQWPHQRLSAARQTTLRTDIVSVDPRHVWASGTRIPEHSPKSYSQLG